MIVILTGAGISAESGLRTYRSDLGLWAEARVEDVATPEGFQRDPERAHAFYMERLRENLDARPNAAHLALARLERESSMPVRLITQNIDTLHERAGSSDPIHMHGQLGLYTCSGCELLHPEVVGNCRGACPRCGLPLRPKITFFGEEIMRGPDIELALANVRIFISIGTSAEVYPAANFVRRAKRRHARRIEVNIARTARSSTFREFYTGPASAMVPQLVDDLLREQRNGADGKL